MVHASCWESGEKIDFFRRSFRKKKRMGPMQLFGALYNWTDDLPKCHRAGVGFQTNQDYSLADGFVGLDRYEDRSFHFQCPDECYLYGVIDGHDGAKVANFAAQKLPAELILGQLKDDFEDEDVRNQLHDSFDCLSKAFVEDLINDSLMDKFKLESHLEGENRKEAAMKYPSLFNDLEKLERDIAGGCSAAIALIHKSKLFIANVGDTRALLCRGDESGDLALVQLSVDHTISTVSELQRLANLGIDIEKLQYSNVLNTTRSIGDWAFKGGYKNDEILHDAETEPVLSSPYIHGGETIGAPMKFLILMSAGVYKAYEEATGTKPNMINNNITSMVHQEILRQKSIDGVAQAVIDEITSLHYEMYLQSNKTKCTKHEDMTLMVRLFNMNLGGKKVRQNSSKLSKKSAKLAPLKIPDPVVMNVKKSSDQDSPSSTGSSTPTSTTVKEVISTPSPGAEGFKEIQYTPPPPSMTSTPAFSNFEPLTVEVEDKFKQIPKPMDYLRRGHTSQVNPPQQPTLPYVMNPSGLYQHCPIQKDAAESIQGSSLDNLKAASNSALLIVTDREISYESPIDSEKSTANSLRENEDKTRLFNRPPEPLETDEHGRIKSYVDFTDLNKKIEDMGGEEAVFGDILKMFKK